MEKHIVELEKKYWQGMEDHDYETVKSLTHFPCIVAGKNGVKSINETEFKTMFESGANNDIKVLKISEVNAQIIDQNTAIIGYEIEFGNADKKENDSMKCVCTSTWIKENNDWFCALHTETELQKM